MDNTAMNLVMSIFVGESQLKLKKTKIKPNGFRWWLLGLQGLHKCKNRDLNKFQAHLPSPRISQVNTLAK